MTIHEINEWVHHLQELRWTIKEALTDNGGELTPEIEEVMKQEENVEEKLMQPEAMDPYGRLFVSQMDEIERLEAERDALDAEIKRCKNSIQRTKIKMGEHLRIIGVESMKGEHYGFKVAVSDTYKADNKAIEASYLDEVKDALKFILPEYVNIKLEGSVSKAKELGDIPEEFFTHNVVETSQFIKPRKSVKTA